MSIKKFGMKIATAQEAQDHLAKVIAEAELGEEVFITCHGKEVAVFRKVEAFTNPASCGG